MTDAMMWETAYIDYCDKLIRETILKFNGGALTVTVAGRSDEEYHWLATVTRNKGSKIVAEGKGRTPTNAIADLKVVRRR